MLVRKWDNQLSRSCTADACIRGQYDQEYLDYLRKLLIKMHENGVAGYVVGLPSGAKKGISDAAR